MINPFEDKEWCLKQIKIMDQSNKVAMFFIGCYIALIIAIVLAVVFK